MIDWHNYLLYLACGPTPYPSRGAIHYIERGSEIPDALLPGRALMRMNERDREGLTKTINTSTPAPWWVRLMCS